MYCPRCGSSQSEELKFCKGCGANLSAVMQVIDSRSDPNEKFNWNKTWVAEMMLSAEEQERRKVERSLHGIAPAVRRYQEIKAGVITSSIGIALTIFLNVFMEGIAESGKVQPDSAQILIRIWVAGLIPTFVGLALIINGWFVSKRLVELAKRHQPQSNSLDEGQAPGSQRPADATQFAPPSAGFSITEGTTKHLGE